MGSRIEYELSDEEYADILAASKPVPYMVFGGVEPMSQQERANRAWRALAEKRGFVWDTVRAGRDERHFTAEADR